MVKKTYVPERGDIVWVNFSPTKGHEQSGVRPALIVSRKIYNQKSHLALVCPITSQAKSYSFEVSVVSPHIKGVVLADQVRSIDWKNRQVEFIDKISNQTIMEVHERLLRLIELN